MNQINNRLFNADILYKNCYYNIFKATGEEQSLNISNIFNGSNMQLLVPDNEYNSAVIHISNNNKPIWLYSPGKIYLYWFEDNKPNLSDINVIIHSDEDILINGIEKNNRYEFIISNENQCIIYGITINYTFENLNLINKIEYFPFEETIINEYNSKYNKTIICNNVMADKIISKGHGKKYFLKGDGSVDKSSYLSDAPNDDKLYCRKNNEWVEFEGGSNNDDDLEDIRKALQQIIGHESWEQLENI